MLKKLQNIALTQQGLATQKAFGSGKQASLKAIEHLGYLQIDTLSVITRAHYHTLWTRIPSFSPEHLHELVEERKVFEYWFHAASYLPMCDYRFTLPQKQSMALGESHYFNDVDKKTLSHVIDRIRIDGPLKSKDFKSSKTKSGSWWNWKPAKHALEKLFMQGDLMITRRDGMTKVYDLTERVLPSSINTQEPSPQEFADYLVNSALRANGFTTIKQITHLRPGKALQESVKKVLLQKIEQRLITELNIDNMPPVYALTDVLDTNPRIPATNVRILSPFDNAIIHRDRLEQLFGFTYKLECYVPKAKRQYGYFCLPILYKNKFVGRVDCKAHRDTKRFELIHLHIDDNIDDMEHFTTNFAKAVYRFATFNDCKTVSLAKVSPKKVNSIADSLII